MILFVRAPAPRSYTTPTVVIRRDLVPPNSSLERVFCKRKLGVLRVV